MVKISIVLTTYNRAKMLTACVNTILYQTFKDFELIIVDDCSTDDTQEVIDGFKTIDNRIIALRTDTQTGGLPAKAKNLGARIAEGDYICFMEDDNFYMLNFLEEMYVKLEDNPDIDVLYCDSNSIRNGVPVGVERSQDFEYPRLRAYNYINICEALMQRESFMRYGWFDETEIIDDWELFLRMATNGAKFLHYPKMLTNYTFHDGMITKDARNTVRLLNMKNRVESGYYVARSNDSD
jgi:glycosyltransferase involved in cell wall biosynthesis